MNSKKNIHYINPEPLTFQRIEEILAGNFQLALSGESRVKIDGCRHYLDQKMKKSKSPVYGITTGFGSLCNRTISHDQLEKLQANLVMSHACGTGELVDDQIVKLMMLLKIHALSLGHSGVQALTVERIITFYNHEVIPLVYEQGSLGASGDLSPLAHLFLPLIGKGKVRYKGKITDASEMLKKLKSEPLHLQSKEGLALLNGTQFMSAHAVFGLLKAFRLLKLADIIGALSLEAYDGRIEPFDERLHQLRPHPGQIETAFNIRKLLEGSEMISRPKKHVQDPYSFRCIPQVHGAVKDTVKYVANVVLAEINAVTDNPTIFPEDDEVLSGGNFHGQPLAFVLDFMAVAMAELANISERRIAQLVLGMRELPEFLVANPGLNSGFMIPQYTAASIVSQNKQLCTPSSVDSITSSNGQEDHVSMGANAATKMVKVIRNVETVLAIELFNAAQAFGFRHPVKTSPYLSDFMNQYRRFVPFIDTDCVMHDHIVSTLRFFNEGEFISL